MQVDSLHAIIGVIFLGVWVVIGQVAFSSGRATSQSPEMHTTPRDSSEHR